MATRATRLAAAAAAVTLAVTLVAEPALAGGRKGGQGGKVSWDVTSYVSGTNAIQAHGKVKGRKKAVKLQVKIPRGWRTLDTDRTNRKGKFAVSDPLEWYGVHKVRVKARGFSKKKKVSIDPGYVPLGVASNHTYLSGRPYKFRFNPCQTLKYRVNAEDVGEAGIVLAQQAMALASRATGIKVKYVGTSTQIPYNAKFHLPKGTDLVIAWATNAEVPDFVNRGADGFGGPNWTRWARDARGKRVAQTLEAGVTLQTEAWSSYYSPAFESTYPNYPIGSLLLHEIGHALGLDHSQGGDQMMATEAWTPHADGVYRAQYGAGDLAGLKQLGLEKGCLRPLRHARMAPVPNEQVP